MTARAGLFEGIYPDAATRYRFFRETLDRLKDDPRVDIAATSSQYRVWGSRGTRITIDGETYQTEEDHPFTRYEVVSWEFFDLVEIEPLAGRSFLATDTADSLPVAIVNRSFAESFWPAENPIGKRIRQAPSEDPTAPLEEPVWRTVVGIVPDMKMTALWQNEDPSAGRGFFVPMTSAETPMFMTLRIRGKEDPRTLAPVLREHVKMTDPGIPLYAIGTPAAIIDEDLTQNRLMVQVFTVFGAVALFLASIGIYGVMSFSVGERIREFAIRMAVGAHARHILRLILRSGAIQILSGLVLGLALAFGLSRFLATILFGISPTDPPVFVSVAFILSTIALLACLFPARRASQVEPLEALRRG